MPDTIIQGDDGAGRLKGLPVDLPGNSKYNKPKAEEPSEKRAERITKNVGRKRERGFAHRFAAGLGAEDGQSVQDYLIFEVLLPAARDMVSDAVSLGINRILYGDSRPRHRHGEPNRTNYSSYSRNQTATGTNNYGSRTISRDAAARHDFGEIVLETRGEAEDVLDRLRDLIKQYDSARVTDLYDLVGITGSFTDDRWGWSDLRDARVKPIRGGYLLVMPRTEPIQ
jgi:hypothetical protein